MWLRKFNNGGIVGGEPENEILKKKQEFADMLFKTGSTPHTRDTSLTKYVTPNDPEWNDIYRPQDFDGYEKEIMEEFVPEGIYIRPDFDGYSYAVRNKRYVIPESEKDIPLGDPELGKTNVDRLAPLDIQFTSPVPRELEEGKRKDYFRQHINPYTKEKFYGSARQADALEKAYFLGKEMPDIGAPEAQDYLSGRYLKWENERDLLPLHRFNMEHNENYTGEEFSNQMVGVLGMEFRDYLRENTDKMKNNYVADSSHAFGGKVKENKSWLNKY